MRAKMILMGLKYFALFWFLLVPVQLHITCFFHILLVGHLEHDSNMAYHLICSS